MHLFIGINGTVLAIDRNTGEIAWQKHLKGGDFVNVVLDGSELYAATKGRVYRLEPATGGIVWENSLAGMGWGLVSIASPPDGNAAAMRRKQQLDEEAPAAG